MLAIVNAPNPALSQKAKPVAKVDQTILNLVRQMEEALDVAIDPIGVGLAAPQVGRNLAIFVIKPSPKSKLQAFINPKITKIENQTVGKTKGKSKKLEGCLSLKDIWGEVERAKAVWLEYTDETGKTHHKKFTGFIATIIQHEVDHLNGVLFPKRVLEQKGTLYESKKNSKGEDIFEELTI
ncbi:MAG: peptide deformylase [Candidatus Levyibacteriota bacterium]|jgi:peptide deformylase